MKEIYTVAVVVQGIAVVLLIVAIMLDRIWLAGICFALYAGIASALHEEYKKLSSCKRNIRP